MLPKKPHTQYNECVSKKEKNCIEKSFKLLLKKSIKKLYFSFMKSFFNAPAQSAPIIIFKRSKTEKEPEKTHIKITITI